MAFSRIFKFNPNHDKRGRFATSSQSGAAAFPEDEQGRRDWFMKSSPEDIANRMKDVGVSIVKPGVVQKDLFSGEMEWANNTLAMQGGYRVDMEDMSDRVFDSKTGTQAKIRETLLQVYEERERLNKEFGVPMDGDGALTLGFAWASNGWGASAVTAYELDDKAHLAGMTKAGHMVINVGLVDSQRLVFYTSTDRNATVAMREGSVLLGNAGITEKGTKAMMANYVRSIYRHEFAHTITNNAMWAEAEKLLYKETFPSSKENGVKLMLSNYSLSSGDEFAAEVFARYTSNILDRNTMTKPMQDFAERMLKVARVNNAKQRSLLADQLFNQSVRKGTVGARMTMLLEPGWEFVPLRERTNTEATGVEDEKLQFRRKGETKVYSFVEYLEATM